MRLIPPETSLRIKIKMMSSCTLTDIPLKGRGYKIHWEHGSTMHSFGLHYWHFMNKDETRVGVCVLVSSTNSL